MQCHRHPPQWIVVAVAILYTAIPGLAQEPKNLREWLASTAASTGRNDPAAVPPIDFPYGTATPSEFCGVCHVAIYAEHAYGFGADSQFKPIINGSMDEPRLAIPDGYANTGTAHHLAGVDPWAIRAREIENNGASCNVCHYPEAFALPDINTPVMNEPVPRIRSRESVGVTCASCHLTPDGKIRGSYGAPAPHQSVADPALRTSAMCAYCHSKGPRVAGKQTQTFYEWREDFFKAGLGQQQCQDCHMPRTTRGLAEIFNVPPRTVGRHLWTGDHSPMRIGQGLTVGLVEVGPDVQTVPADQTQLQIHVINVAAGHSVPTGSNRRAVYLEAEILAGDQSAVATQEWMFAPWYGNRPDDRAFLEDDQKKPDAIAASQADAQGPHEAPVRAGEDRILLWSIQLPPGDYTLRATLIYDLNRYNDRAFTDDQTQIYRSSIPITVK